MTNDEIREVINDFGFIHVSHYGDVLCNIDQLTKFAELIQARAWQPIETAPKDGTEIDLLDSYGRRWTDKSYAYHHWLHGKPTKDKSWGPFPSDGPTPVITHWMPKPPPAIGKEGK